MSKLNDPSDLFHSPDTSGDFGRDEGMTVYAVTSMDNPDRTISSGAEFAARVAMVAAGRFDVDPHVAARAIVNELTAGFPDPGEVVDENKEK